MKESITIISLIIKALNTLSNALAQRPIEQMMEAWQLVISCYGEGIEKVGKKFVRIALIDSSLIKLSLAAYDWAQYRKQKEAAKMHMVLEWRRCIPEQLTITTGKVNNLNKKVKVAWQAGWTYVQDRGYLCFTRLKSIIAAGAHFVVRVKCNTDFQVLERREVDTLIGKRMVSVCAVIGPLGLSVGPILYCA
ncbi:MAG: hypothetical protein AB1489_40010 [Acidobacteriota bacterium]